MIVITIADDGDRTSYSITSTKESIGRKKVEEMLEYVKSQQQERSLSRRTTKQEIDKPR